MSTSPDGAMHCDVCGRNFAEPTSICDFCGKGFGDEAKTFCPNCGDDFGRVLSEPALCSACGASVIPGDQIGEFDDYAWVL